MRIYLAALFIPIILAGCAGQPARDAVSQGFFHDELFAASRKLPVSEIFAVSEEMQAFLDKEIPPHQRHRDAPRALINALNSNGQFRLEYESMRTRTASQAFQSRRGNCLSLVIMTSALAKSLGMQVHYQKVLVNDTWSREQGTLFRSGHVNIVLGARQRDGLYLLPYEPSIIVDFLPPEDISRLRSIELSEAAVIAMFMNNRAAESLAAGDLDAAYGFARSAIEADPTFHEAMNTLGVIYRRHGNLREAEAVLSKALESSPDNTQLLANLALALQQQGKTEASRKLELRLKTLEQYAPFYFLDQARSAMASRDFGKALEFFKRELDRDPDSHEAHFGLARAFLALGDPRAARSHLQEAIEHSNTSEDKNIYTAKLARLRASLVN